MVVGGVVGLGAGDVPLDLAHDRIPLLLVPVPVLAAKSVLTEDAHPALHPEALRHALTAFFGRGGVGAEKFGFELHEGTGGVEGEVVFDAAGPDGIGEVGVFEVEEDLGLQ